VKVKERTRKEKVLEARPIEDFEDLPLGQD